MAYTSPTRRRTTNNNTLTTDNRTGFEILQEVDNTDGFINLLSLDESVGTSTLDNLSSLNVTHQGGAVAEIQIQVTDYKNNSNVDEANSVDLGPGSATTTRYITTLLRPGEGISLPNARWISYAEDASGGNATAVDDTDPHDINSAKQFVDTGINLGEDLDGTETVVTTSDGDYFRVGDLIQCGQVVTDGNADEIEIMKVTGISTNDLTVERALYGTQAGVSGTQSTGHVNGANIYLPFFNTLHDWNDTSTQGSGNGDGSTTRIKTNGSGRFHAFNLMGYGRTADNVADGLLPGSFYMYFREPGYQELGLSGIGPQTDSGLTSGTTYQFNITEGAGSAFSLSFTCVGTQFGGADGVIAKINSALSTAFKATSGNLKDRGVRCSLTAEGDIRFTSLNRTAASAIALADSSGSDTDWWGVGRIPAVASIETAVASRFPDLKRSNQVTGLLKTDHSLFAYDDGYGTISGAADGSLNYDTGEIMLTNAPQNAEWKFGVMTKSAHCGGNKTATDKQNTIISIGARSVSTKWNSRVKISARR